MNVNKMQSGFSMIELILFIVIIGITVSSLMLTLQTILTNAPNANRQTIAVGLAQGRMEMILGQFQEKGYDNFTDPCTWASPPPMCTALAGYTVTATITQTTIAGDSNYKTITVTASGLGNASLISLVSS